MWKCHFFLQDAVTVELSSSDRDESGELSNLNTGMWVGIASKDWYRFRIREALEIRVVHSGSTGKGKKIPLEHGNVGRVPRIVGGTLETVALFFFFKLNWINNFITSNHQIKPTRHSTTTDFFFMIMTTSRCTIEFICYIQLTPEKCCLATCSPLRRFSKLLVLRKKFIEIIRTKIHWYSFIYIIRKIIFEYLINLTV